MAEAYLCERCGFMHDRIGGPCRCPNETSVQPGWKRRQAPKGFEAGNVDTASADAAEDAVIAATYAGQPSIAERRAAARARNPWYYDRQLKRMMRRDDEVQPA